MRKKGELNGVEANFSVFLHSLNALRKYDNDYTWLVFLSNVGDVWASKSSTKVWRNICGKSIVVWRVKKEHAGRKTSKTISKSSMIY